GRGGSSPRPAFAPWVLRSSRNRRDVPAKALQPRSFATSDGESENTVLDEVGIVVAAGDFQTVELDLAGGERLVVRRSLAMEPIHLHRRDAGHRLRRGDQRAQINRLAEAESIRMEQAEPAAGQDPITEELEQFLLHV